MSGGRRPPGTTPRCLEYIPGGNRGLCTRDAKKLVPAALVLVALAGCDRRAPSALDSRGPAAHRLAGLWWLMFGLAIAIYAVVAGLVLFGAVRGRPAGSSRRTDDAFIWLGGIAGPVAVLMLLAVVTVTTTNALVRNEPGALRIEAVGHDWWWEVRYPGTGVVTADEIHVPAGRPVELGLRSDDVIHSFWVPQLAGKVDMIPGQRNVLRFEAGRPGTYRGQCAEFCGIQHANMSFLVIAEPAGDFGRWLTREQLLRGEPASQSSAEGEAVFVRNSCAGCHTIRGTEAHGTLGPDLTDFGSRRTIGAGTLPNIRGNLGGWIANAQSLKPGSLMPPVNLSSSDLLALVDYLESRR